MPSAHINKILEVDMDTDRITQLIIRQVSSVGYDRERQPNPDTDVKDDIVILVNALGCAILKAERDGVCKKGEAMGKSLDLLLDVYADATAEVKDRIFDKQGNKIDEKK